MLAPSAGTLPRGHVLVEPYLYDVIEYGQYDRKGAMQAASHSNTFGSLSYIIYGLADRISVGIIPTFGYTSSNGGLSSSGVRVGDIALLAQYRLAQYQGGSWIPTTSVSIQQSLPTGAYDRLGKRASNGFGSGAYTTTLSLYTQTYFWVNRRILRLRLNVSQAFSSTAKIDGVSVYGTSSTFHGYARPGNAFTLDLAQEYSITRHWVVAIDEVYHHSASTRVVGTAGTVDFGASGGYYLAPALEYNWTGNAGVLIGVRTVPAAFNSSATVTPAIAINMVR
jgi:hypothetical protein